MVLVGASTGSAEAAMVSVAMVTANSAISEILRMGTPWSLTGTAGLRLLGGVMRQPA